MKNLFKNLNVCFLLGSLLATTAILANQKTVFADKIEGSWQIQEGNIQHVILIQDNYYTQTSFDVASKNFVQTNGGTYMVNGSEVNTVVEFDTNDKDRVGESNTYQFKIEGNQLKIGQDGDQQVWTRIDNGQENLAGTWKITARKQDGTISPIMQTGPRKTLKILTGNRFQWVAINPATKEFFGTGGGNYTFKNGEYTENIEFFSRDNTRVGASLSFSGKLEDGNWHHSGKSSKGDDIYEVWTRINK